jgi:ubiquinone/menaquinone biosynthesis C-methylase UbiE
MEYTIKQEYLTQRSAARYHRQYRQSLRAKLANWAERRAFRTLLNGCPSDQRVLDIACGTGRFLEELTGHEHRTTGIDISPQMLDIARSRVERHPLLEGLRIGDAEHLPFDTASFDGVTCMRLYHKVPSAPRIAMLKEVRRVGRGWAILYFAMSTPLLDARREWLTRVRKYHAQRYALTQAELERELALAGLHLRRQVRVLPGVFESQLVFVTW